MTFESAPEFLKDLKRLTKKWRSLPSDLADAKLQLLALYGDGTDGAVEPAEIRLLFFNGKRAAVLQKTDNYELVKMRLDVASLGTSSKVRLIFVYSKQPTAITLLELYAKSDKSVIDKARATKYLR